MLGVVTKEADEIKNVFRLCGLVASSAFDKVELHPPLRDMHNWHLRYQHLVDEDDDREELCIHSPAWYLPEDIRSSLFYCLRHTLARAVAVYVAVLTNYMQELDDLKGLYNDDYITAIRSGGTGGSELELFAASRLHCCNIQVKTLNNGCKVISMYTYTVTSAPERFVLLVSVSTILQVNKMQI